VRAGAGAGAGAEDCTSWAKAGAGRNASRQSKGRDIGHLFGTEAQMVPERLKPPWERRRPGIRKT
jgi:hypothetical protein